MTFREAKDLKLDDKVFTIGKDSRVYTKRVSGIKFTDTREIDITYINHHKENVTEKNLASGYILPHSEVFLRESDALQIILAAKESQIRSINDSASSIRTRLKVLEREKENKHIEKYGE